MDGKRIALTVVLVVIVIGALAGIGFAVYRWGYAQGAAASLPMATMHRFIAEDGPEFPRQFRPFTRFGLHQPGMFWGGAPYFAYGWLGLGLLLLVLAGVAVGLLIGRSRSAGS